MSQTATSLTSASSLTSFPAWIYGRLAIQVEDAAAFLEDPLVEEAVRGAVASLCDVPVESVTVFFEVDRRRLSSSTGGVVWAMFVVRAVSAALARAAAASLEAEGTAQSATELLQASLQTKSGSSHHIVAVGSVAVDTVVDAVAGGGDASPSPADLAAKEAACNSPRGAGMVLSVAVSATLIGCSGATAAAICVFRRRWSIQDAKCKEVAMYEVEYDIGGATLEATAPVQPSLLAVAASQEPLDFDTLFPDDTDEFNSPWGRAGPSAAASEGAAQPVLSPRFGLSSRVLVKPCIPQAMDFDAPELNDFHPLRFEEAVAAEDAREALRPRLGLRSSQRALAKPPVLQGGREAPALISGPTSPAAAVLGGVPRESSPASAWRSDWSRRTAAPAFAVNLLVRAGPSPMPQGLPWVGEVDVALNGAREEDALRALRRRDFCGPDEWQLWAAQETETEVEAEQRKRRVPTKPPGPLASDYDRPQVRRAPASQEAPSPMPGPGPPTRARPPPTPQADDGVALIPSARDWDLAGPSAWRYWPTPETETEAQQKQRRVLVKPPTPHAAEFEQPLARRAVASRGAQEALSPTFRPGVAARARPPPPREDDGVALLPSARHPSLGGPESQRIPATPSGTDAARLRVPRLKTTTCGSIDSCKGVSAQGGARAIGSHFVLPLDQVTHL